MPKRIFIYSFMGSKIVALAVWGVTGSWILAAPFGILAGGSPFALDYFRRQRRTRLLSLQLRQSIQTMVHCLSVGTSFYQALERVAQEGDLPLSKEWTIVMNSVRIGTSLSQALSELEQRVPLKEMTWFVTAAQVAQDTGGSLAGVLETLAATLQERETFREKVSALTAQGKASGALLSALPFLMLGALGVVAPDFVRPLFQTPGGQGILVAVMGCLTVGGLVIFKIVSIKAD